MKILQLVEFFPETKKGEISGGVESRCFFVSKYLEDMGHKVNIISRPTTRWAAASWQSLPERVLFTAEMIIRGLQTDFDIVEGTNYTNHLVAVMLGLLKRRPVVCWYADVFVGQWINNVGVVGIFGEIAERILFKIPFVNYIAISQTTRAKLIKNGVEVNKISVVYCGVPQVILKRMAKFDICAVSRLLKYKHLDDLIFASKGLKMAIVGQGPQEKKLRKISSKNVHFFGFVKNHNDVMKIMASSKIFCHPSTVEGFGIVVVEAMSLGTPAVVADIPVMREITHGGKGALFFKPRDVADLSDKLHDLLSDKKLYNKKVIEAKKLAKGYSWGKISAQTEAVYRGLTKNLKEC